MDLLQISALILISLFILSLISGRHSDLLAVGLLSALLAVFIGAAYLFYVGFNPVVVAAVVAASAAIVIMLRRYSIDDIIEVLAFMLVPVLFFGILALMAFGLMALSMLVIWTVYLFYIAHPLVKAVVVTVSVGLTALLIRRRKKGGQKEEEKKKPLFDIRLADKRCVPLEDGLKMLPSNVASAIEKVLGMPSEVYKLCLETYKGEDVPGGRSEVMSLKLLFAPDIIAMNLLKALGELGLHPRAEKRELGWAIYFQNQQPPTAKPNAEKGRK